MCEKHENLVSRDVVKYLRNLLSSRKYLRSKFSQNYFSVIYIVAKDIYYIKDFLLFFNYFNYFYILNYLDFFIIIYY